MLAIERRREIISRLTLDGKVIVSELAKDFGVTEETIRRDLEKLDRDGIASKTYGGAVSKRSSGLDLPYSVREGVNVEEKQAIADCIAELIEDGERLMVDSSSTALYVIKRIKDKKNRTIITNSVKILLELADKQDWWFHAKSVPGSHVVLVTEGREPTDLDFTTAAEIAAYYSKAEGDNIAVDYLLAKHVKRGAGGKPGFVIYHTNWTAYVTPNADKIASLRKR